MEYFELLEFKPHNVEGGTHARHMFDNGFGVSIITGRMFYTASDKPYEMAVICTDKFEITYGTVITADVVGWLDAQDVNDYMYYISQLPKYEGELEKTKYELDEETAMAFKLRWM